MQKVKDIYTYISKFINTRINRVVSTFQNSLNISKKEATIYIKTILLFFIVLLFVSYYFQYDNFISFAVSASVTIIYYSFISRDLRKHNRKIKDLQRKYNANIKYPSNGLRILAVVLFAGISVLFTLGFETEVITELFKTLHIDANKQALIQLKSLIITAPIIFIIWIFRDKNKLLQLENDRKDTNLKEFQQLQRWATGNIDGENKENKIALQVSALHSLRGYLKGEYGESFRRGAYEIFRSVLKIQHDKILEKVKNNEEKNISDAIKNCQLTTQINTIAVEEWFNLLINHDFPTNDMSLVGVDFSKKSDIRLKHKKYGKSLNLNGVNFNSATFENVNFSNSTILDANFINAKLSNSIFIGSYLINVNFNGSNLSDSDFRGVSFGNSTFIGSFLGGVDFSGACFPLSFVGEVASNFSGSYFYNTNLTGIGRISYIDDFKKTIKKQVEKDISPADIVDCDLTEDSKAELLDKLKEFKNKEHYYIDEVIKNIEETNKSYNLDKAITGKLTKKMAKKIIKDYNNQIVYLK
jgi:uncharacterized protein YjbI with pentapeptide repeats